MISQPALHLVGHLLLRYAFLLQFWVLIPITCHHLQLLTMAPVAFSPLLAEFPEFNPDEAPGAEGVDEGALDSGWWWA